MLVPTIQHALRNTSCSTISWLMLTLTTSCHCSLSGLASLRGRPRPSWCVWATTRVCRSSQEGLPFFSRFRAASASASQANRRLLRCQHFFSHSACVRFTCRCTLAIARCSDVLVRTMTQRSCPCGRFMLRQAKCMLPSSEVCHVWLLAMSACFAWLDVSETRLIHLILA